jgi:hypothetical protein
MFRGYRNLPRRCVICGAFTGWKKVNVTRCDDCNNIIKKFGYDAIIERRRK